MLLSADGDRFVLGSGAVSYRKRFLQIIRWEYCKD